jgi:hypothetical protein
MPDSLLVDIVNATHGTKCAVENLEHTLAEMLKVLQEIRDELKNRD